MRIASDIIEAIKAKADIVEVIGEYVPLNKSGQNYKGLCPFHSDTTPSLTVNSAKGIYKCFACDASGDVFTFLQEYLKISFQETVKMLAEKYKIEIPDGISILADDAQQRKRESMYIINDYATQYFAETYLQKPKNHRKPWLIQQTAGLWITSNPLALVMQAIVGMVSLHGLKAKDLTRILCWKWDC